MKEMWRQFRKGAIAVSCCMLALGILMVLWPDISALTICIILGIFCIAAGVYAMVRYFKLGVAGLFFRSDLSFGICSILLGVLLLLHPYGAMIFLPIAAGFFMIIGSVLDIQVSIEMRRLHFGNWGVMLILGIINIIFAFLLLMNPFQGASVLVIFVGISLVVDSIQNFYSIYCISKAIKASKSNQIIDVEWYPAD
ncbi:MAG: hypothetical protein HDQ96_09985 [Lachnospiraceae bacterium]|nr:hypothetical protein [Lachnospiraceae bacterium]